MVGYLSETAVIQLQVGFLISVPTLIQSAHKKVSFQKVPVTQENTVTLFFCNWNESKDGMK